MNQTKRDKKFWHNYMYLGYEAQGRSRSFFLVVEVTRKGTQGGGSPKGVVLFSFKIVCN
jgi:hypothetical protein